MGLGGRSKAVQALRLGAAAAVHIKTAHLFTFKIKLKCLFHGSTFSPYSLHFRIAATSSITACSAADIGVK